jgi:hypothetical protein
MNPTIMENFLPMVVSSAPTIGDVIIYVNENILYIEDILISLILNIKLT